MSFAYSGSERMPRIADADLRAGPAINGDFDAAHRFGHADQSAHIVTHVLGLSVTRHGDRKLGHRLHRVRGCDRPAPRHEDRGSALPDHGRHERIHEGLRVNEYVKFGRSADRDWRID